MPTQEKEICDVPVSSNRLLVPVIDLVVQQLKFDGRIGLVPILDALKSDVVAWSALSGDGGYVDSQLAAVERENEQLLKLNESLLNRVDELEAASTELVGPDIHRNDVLHLEKQMEEVEEAFSQVLGPTFPDQPTWPYDGERTVSQNVIDVLEGLKDAIAENNRLSDSNEELLKANAEQGKRIEELEQEILVRDTELKKRDGFKDKVKSLETAAEEWKAAAEKNLGLLVASDKARKELEARLLKLEGKPAEKANTAKDAAVKVTKSETKDESSKGAIPRWGMQMTPQFALRIFRQAVQGISIDFGAIGLAGTARQEAEKFLTNKESLIKTIQEKPESEQQAFFDTLLANWTESYEKNRF